jgi:hypothetical protein
MFMTWFERVLRRDVSDNPGDAPSDLSLVALVPGPGDVAGRMGPQRHGRGPSEAERLLGMTTQQLQETLALDVPRSILLTGLINALDDKDYDRRTQAGQALSLVLSMAPQHVLPALLLARDQPLCLEHQRRIDQVIAEYLSHGSTSNGFTYDGFGRPTHFVSDSYDVTIAWATTPLERIDCIVAVGDGINNRVSHVLFRQPDGRYLVYHLSPRSGELTPMGTARAGDVSFTPGNPGILTYRVTLLEGGETVTYTHQIRH